MILQMNSMIRVRLCGSRASYGRCEVPLPEEVRGEDQDITTIMGDVDLRRRRPPRAMRLAAFSTCTVNKPVCVSMAYGISHNGDTRCSFGSDSHTNEVRA